MCKVSSTYLYIYGSSLYIFPTLCTLCMLRAKAKAWICANPGLSCANQGPRSRGGGGGGGGGKGAAAPPPPPPLFWPIIIADASAYTYVQVHARASRRAAAPSICTCIHVYVADQPEFFFFCYIVQCLTLDSYSDLIVS